MTDLDVAALRWLHENVTPGSWVPDKYDVYETHSEHGDVVAECGLSTLDAKYIAALRNNAPALLGAAEALERVQALIDSWIEYFTPNAGHSGADWMLAAANDLFAAIEGTP